MASRISELEIGPPDIGFGGLQPTIFLRPSSDLADPEGNEFCLLRHRLGSAQVAGHA